MVADWNDSTPIYLQLRERVLAQILDGAIRPGEPLPSVRQVAGELAINPLTVSKAYQSLADEGVVEKRRGLGLYVADNADRDVRERERERFLTEEWPRLVMRIHRLGLTPAELLRELPNTRETT
jgi:GntR family transcriptional regulator